MDKLSEYYKSTSFVDRASLSKKKISQIITKVHHWLIGHHYRKRNQEHGTKVVVIVSTLHYLLFENKKQKIEIFSSMQRHANHRD